MARYLTIQVTVFLKVLLCNSVHAEKPNFIIILTDDQGWADFSANQIDGSLKTPNLDRLVQSGINFTNGYTCAPQCVPARTGLLLGKAPNRIGIERNGDSLEPFSQEANLAELLSENGYSCAMIGKWHLGPSNEIQNHGFRFFYNQVASSPFWANFSEKGALSGTRKIRASSYHINGCSKTALSFISQYSQEPFLLLLSYRAPHVPLDCPERYLSKFSNKLPAARRQALGMFSAIDYGIGLIQDELRRLNLTEKTCIFFLSDNGAPLKLEAKDAAHPALGWNGSYNSPLNGEKGMLTEGGIRVPFAISWPGEIPPRSSYDHPITSLDIAPTILSQVGIEKEGLDGINLLPYLQGEKEGSPHAFLCWRWIAQAAIRVGKWKLLKCEDREYLFNLEEDLSERENLIHKFPLVSENLEKKLSNWAQELNPPGLKNGELPEIWEEYFDYHLGEK
jgi:arylsulfatase A-like enzyme